MTEEQGRRVLIAEDEALIRLDLREMLIEEGYDVCGEAGDGEEAVKLAEQLRPDLVIMDIKMPIRMGGRPSGSPAPASLPGHHHRVLAARPGRRARAPARWHKWSAFQESDWSAKRSRCPLSRDAGAGERVSTSPPVETASSSSAKGTLMAAFGMSEPRVPLIRAPMDT